MPILAVYNVCSSTVAVSPLEKGFQVIASSMPHGALYKVHGVFNNTDLLSTSVRLQKITETSYIGESLGCL